MTAARGGAAAMAALSLFALGSGPDGDRTPSPPSGRSADPRPLDDPRAADIRRAQEAVLVEARRLEAAMERLSESLRASEPENAARLSRGLAVLRGRLVQDALRASLDALAAGRYPEAVERQSEAVAAMEELLEALRQAAGKPGSSSEESARRARALLEQIEKLAAAQAAEIEKMRAAESGKAPPDASALAAAQEALRSEALRAAEAEKPPAGVEDRPAAARESLQSAAEAMGGSADSLRKGKTREGRGKAEEALARLEGARQRVIQVLREEEEEVRRRVVEDLKSILAEIARRQARVIRETERWAKDAASPRARSLSLRTLGEEEAAVGGHVRDAAARIVKEGSPAFSDSLESLSADLAEASERLGREVADEHTLRIERDAARQIEFLLQVLSDNRNPKASMPGRRPEEKPDASRTLLGRDAEIRLLKRLEERVLERLRALEVARRIRGDADPDRAGHLARLREEQSRVRGLVERLDEESRVQRPGRRPKEASRIPRPPAPPPPGPEQKP